MKMFFAMLSTETNTFSPMPTGQDNFNVTRGIDLDNAPPEALGPLLLLKEAAQQHDWSVAMSLIAEAQPAGRTVRAVYELLRDEILDDLRQTMPVDIVLLGLHGAMVAEGYDDCEGDLLARIREIVGVDAVVGALLDPHCHLTQKMVENATILIAQKEYPHIDFMERIKELLDIVADAAEGKVEPITSVYDCRMIGAYHTPREPMRSYVDRLIELEGKKGVLSISVAHGFPWGDVPDMGTKVWVVTDKASEYGGREFGHRLAEELGRELYNMREALQPNYLTIDEALEQALAIDRSPVVLADFSDNAGGGAPSDSTFVLRAMLERGIENAALACVWDPIAVSIAMNAGVGAQLDLRIGGKIGPMSGDPLDLHVEVIGVQPDATQSFGPEGKSSLGDTVAVRAGGIDIVLNSIRTQTLSPECFSTVGIDPQQRHILVVKSSQHFYAAFAPIAAEVLYVAAPGAINPDLTRLPYRRINKKMWPFVEDPFAS